MRGLNGFREYLLLLFDMEFLQDRTAIGYVAGIRKCTRTHVIINIH